MSHIDALVKLRQARNWEIVSIAVSITLWAGTCKGCELADAEIKRRLAVVDGCKCPDEAAP